ncbi:MAG: GlxA family transcriptional regulator [Bacteroidota bacterium]
MKHLTILVPKGKNNLSSIIGAYKVFKKANEYQQQLAKKEVFKIELAGLSRTVTFHDDLFTVKPHTNIAAIKKTDLIIIPAIGKSFSETLIANSALVQWVRHQYTKGAEVASICTGVFVLASTGRLKGRNASTHWYAEEVFKKMFPDVKLQSGKLITDEKGIYTNGGAFSFLNLLIYLIEKYYDRRTAIFCSKIFQIDIDRNSQAAYAMFSTEKDHQDELVKNAQDLIERNRDPHLSFYEIANHLAISRRNFDRRFLNATGFTPAEYRQRVKVEMAKKAFESSRKQVQEVMYDVGYSDIKAFREVFRNITGLTPLEYRNKYNREFSTV